MYHKNLCRVHWLLLDLSSDFKGYYKLLFDYAEHKYVFYRTYCNQRSPRLKEIYIVIRSSKRCYRLMYYNNYKNLFDCKNFRTVHECADYMHYLYKTR